EEMLRAHQLLDSYSPAPRWIDSDFSGQHEAVSAYWRGWWQRSLRPGAGVTFYSDAACRIQVGAPAAADRTFPAAPSDGRAVAWDAVLGSGTDQVALLSLRRGGAARAWLDGVPLALTADGRSTSRTARLLLNNGEHPL